MFDYSGSWMCQRERQAITVDMDGELEVHYQLDSCSSSLQKSYHESKAITLSDKSGLCCKEVGALIKYYMREDCPSSSQNGIPPQKITLPPNHSILHTQ